MEKVRRIIHLDLDAFYCAVEENHRPELRGKPFAVGGSPKGRGVVSSCSYAARAYGVRSAMRMSEAVSRCPNLIIVGPDFKKYRPASQGVMKRLRELTPLVEQISIDEAFLDVSDLPGPIETIARQLQGGIHTQLDLPNSLGIATNKLVAKIATDVGKMGATKGIPPNAITIVPPGGEAEFLAPLPVRMLWGIGPASAEKLAREKVTTIGGIAQLPYPILKKVFKNAAYEMNQRALGIDYRPIVTDHDPKSISQEVTFNQDTRDTVKLRQILEKQSQNIARQLQKQKLIARTVKLKLRWSTFTTLSRQTTLTDPSDDGALFAATAIKLFDKAWDDKEEDFEVRLIGVGVSGLEAPPQQIGLWDRDWEKEERLQNALALLREKYDDQVPIRGIPKKKDRET
jgi:DNA polymerase IV